MDWTFGFWKFCLPAAATRGWQIGGEDSSATRCSLLRMLANCGRTCKDDVLKAARGELARKAARDADFYHPNRKPFMVYELYLQANARAHGRITVPILWDSKDVSIVNNESSEIIRLLDDKTIRTLAAAAPRPGGAGAPAVPQVPVPPSLLYPAWNRDHIDELNVVIGRLNNGVYRVGFGRTPEAVLAASNDLFGALDYLEAVIQQRAPGRETGASRRFIAGDELSEADVRLFPTILRFDIGYYTAFRCDRRTLRNGYPYLQSYLERLLAIPAFNDDVDMIAYPTMYFIICQWQGRVFANLLRMAIVVLTLAVCAARPDAPRWRRRIAAVLTAPLWLWAWVVR